MHKSNQKDHTMTKKQYDALFKKAQTFYIEHQDAPKISEVPNYENFKLIANELIASDYNDITIIPNHSNKYLHYEKLNRLFLMNQPAKQPKDLMALEL
jgi:predicted nucleotidyltransferase